MAQSKAPSFHLPDSIRRLWLKTDVNSIALSYVSRHEGELNNSVPEGYILRLSFTIPGIAVVIVIQRFASTKALLTLAVGLCAGLMLH